MLQLLPGHSPSLPEFLVHTTTQQGGQRYKGECQEKNFSGDWKERKCSLCVPAHVMLRDSGAFLFFQIHLVIVTALSVSEARQAAWLKRVNHSSI